MVELAAVVFVFLVIASIAWAVVTAIVNLTTPTAEQHLREMRRIEEEGERNRAFWRALGGSILKIVRRVRGRASG